MRALKILLYIVLGLAAAVIGLGFFATKEYHVERSIEINAPHDTVFEQVRFFKNFPKWSPWQGIDPKMKTSISGTDGEVGAAYTWSGNDDVGTGTQTIKSITPQRIDIELAFKEPWESVSPSFIKLEDKGAKTHVSWGFDMHIGFPWNAFAMFTNVDAAVGKDYEHGLANLKRICEELAHPKYRGYEVTESDIPVKYYVGVRKVVPFAEIPAFFMNTLPLAMSTVQEQGLPLAGAPSGLFWTHDDSTGTADMAAVVPTSVEKKLGGGVGVFTVGGGRALVIDYYGVYDSTGKAHYAMGDYMTQKKLRNIPPAVEEYITDPGAEPDTSKWLTKIIYFVEPLPKDSLVRSPMDR